MAVNVLVVGSGGREHALARSLAASPAVEKVFVAPGNPGTSGRKVECVTNVNVSNHDGLAVWCQENSVAMAVIGPEAPLAAGLADVLSKASIRCFGPSAVAARVEADKGWAKAFMDRHSIPTARWGSFSDVQAACDHIDSAGYECLVVKASGLAAGKGVVVAENKQQAKDAVHSILSNKKFGAAGETVVLEEKLVGPEISVLAFCDGRHAVCMPPAQDHKALLEGNTGPNTGGMGAIAPALDISPEMMAAISRDIVQKTVSGMREEQCPYVGALYAGLMITADGPKVLEFNCRFGDPEAQVVLPLLESDLYATLRACVDGQLEAHPVNFHRDLSAAAVVLVSEGYPGSYPRGREITGLEQAETIPGVWICHAGTAMKDGKLVTNGGRVLAVAATSPKSLGQAVEDAYQGVERVHFDGAFHRTDIGLKARQNA